MHDDASPVSTMRPGSCLVAPIRWVDTALDLEEGMRRLERTARLVGGSR